MYIECSLNGKYQRNYEIRSGGKSLLCLWVLCLLTLPLSILMNVSIVTAFVSRVPSSNQSNVASEMAKPVQPAVLHENGREQPDERDNEIVIELDRENQYGRTQPRANEPQGNHLIGHRVSLHSLCPNTLFVTSCTKIPRFCLFPTDPLRSRSNESVVYR